MVKKNIRHRNTPFIFQQYYTAGNIKVKYFPKRPLNYLISISAKCHRQWWCLGIIKKKPTCTSCLLQMIVITYKLYYIMYLVTIL